MNTVKKPVAAAGSKVTYLHPKRPGQQKCALGMTAENDPSVPCISCATPVGKALLGKRPGDKVQIELLNGDMVTLEIIDVEPASIAAVA